MDRDCDFCKLKGITRSAVVNCMTILGQWAYCCERCRRLYSVGRFNRRLGVHMLEIVLADLDYMSLVNIGKARRELP